MKNIRLDSVRTIIGINTIVYLLLYILRNILNIFGDMGANDIVSHWIFDPIMPLDRPWTFFTYMWIHDGILHLVLNIILIYYFGLIFVRKNGDKKLLLLYVLSGILASVVYYIFTLLLRIPFDSVDYWLMNKPLIGASGAIMAIVFAVSYQEQEMQISFGMNIRVSVKMIAFLILFIPVLWQYNNYGGHIAHITGALVGYLYALDEKKHKISVVDCLLNPKLIKVKYGKSKEKKQSNHSILEKVKQSGYKSLSEQEKKDLIDTSK